MSITPNVKTTNNYFERTETLTQYYRDVHEYDVMSAEEEKEIFNKFTDAKRKFTRAKEKGDRESAKKYKAEYMKIREAIINANLRFVISVARVYASNSNILDLIDEGNIGLIEAVESFDVSLGNRFQTHAIYLIRQKINIYRQNDNLMVRKNNESKTYHIMSNMTNRFIQENGREPTSDELKDFINEHYPNANIKCSADVLNIKVSSIDETNDIDGNESNIGNINMFNAYSASHNSYEDSIEKDKLRLLINTLMRKLSDRDKTIIKMHFGIEQKYNASSPISDIADAVGLTPTRVRQLIVEIKEAMKKEYSSSLEAL